MPTDTYLSDTSVQVMTRVNALGGVGSVPDTTPLRQRRKAVLVCPSCGHESPVDGDWVETLRDETVDVSCPDCRTLLTRRWRRE
ncbi:MULTISPECIES: hypothetical protein [Salinibaculum]|uniref:hypothetical protein n=1 Tax=Salinibaculum TaxID=2732368 RepID=UPI0030D5D0AC